MKTNTLLIVLLIVGLIVAVYFFTKKDEDQGQGVVNIYQYGEGGDGSQNPKWVNQGNGVIGFLKNLLGLGETAYSTYNNTIGSKNQAETTASFAGTDNTIQIW